MFQRALRAAACSVSSGRMAARPRQMSSPWVRRARWPRWKRRMSAGTVRSARLSTLPEKVGRLLLLVGLHAATRDADVDVGRLGPQRPHRALLLGTVGEGVEAEVVVGVAVADLLDLVVGHAVDRLHQQLR